MIPNHGKDLCILAQPGSRLPGRALFVKLHTGDGLAIKSIRSNWLKRFKRLPGGEARLGNGPVDRFRAERAEPKALPGASAGRGIRGAIQLYAEVFGMTPPGAGPDTGRAGSRQTSPA